jgi:hypothetical protein
MYIGPQVNYPLFLPDFNKTYFLDSNTKFHENPSIGSRVVPRGKTDGHGETNGLFFAILRTRIKMTNVYWISFYLCRQFKIWIAQTIKNIHFTAPWTVPLGATTPFPPPPTPWPRKFITNSRTYSKHMFGIIELLHIARYVLSARCLPSYNHLILEADPVLSNPPLHW